MDQQFTGEHLLDLEIDPIVSRSFREATRWAKFIAIVYSVILGIFLICLIALAAGGAFYEGFMSQIQESPVATMLGSILLIVLGVGAVIGVILLILLFRFSVFTKNGLERQEQSGFNAGLKSLKNYFLIQGIFSLLYLVLILITTISGFFTTNF
jgi:hypothetical protein